MRYDGGGRSVPDTDEEDVGRAQRMLALPPGWEAV